MKSLFVSLLALMATATLSAQSITGIYNEAVASYQAKDFKAAAEKFEKVINDGMDSEEAASVVATAKKTLPKCYFMMGGMNFKGNNFEEAVKAFQKSAEVAELYGDLQQMNKANMWQARVYQKQGGDAFNSKDYATAAEIFGKGYKADPDNTNMALNLAMSYCELGKYVEGMEIYEEIAAKTHPKYAEDAAQAKKMIALYTNNQVAKMQAANDFDGMLTMAESMLEKNAQSPIAHNVRLQALTAKKDYAKVIEYGPAAVEAQDNEEDKSYINFLVGAAYNAKEMRDQAIASFQKVTAGPAVESAQKALADLQK